MQTIGIIGGGAWGSALANVMAGAGRHVLLWAREDDVVTSINIRHVNDLFLSGVPLHPSIRATSSFADLSPCTALLVVTPAQHLGSTLHALKPHIGGDVPIIICAKGVDIATGKLMSEIACETLPSAPVAILTGPTFAAEIARGLPCAVTLAMDDGKAAEKMCESLSTRTFRMYASDDVIGAQIGGAVKNVIAIACGMIEGLKMGDSARAALITRGLAEISRLAVALGGKKETLMGMCGVGDLLLTCSSMQSRNFSLGFALGEGKTLDDILASRAAVTEGVHTATALYALSQKHGVDMPISNAVYHMLTQKARAQDVIGQLLDRPVKAEKV